jgi:hypothetical protein
LAGILTAGALIFGTPDNSYKIGNDVAYGQAATWAAACGLARNLAANATDPERARALRGNAEFSCRMADQFAQQERDEAIRQAGEAQAQGMRDAARIQAESNGNNCNQINENARAQQQQYEQRINILEGENRTLRDGNAQLRGGLEEGAKVINEYARIINEYARVINEYAKNEEEKNWTFGLPEVFTFNGWNDANGDGSWELSELPGIKNAFDSRTESIAAGALWKVRNCNLCKKKISLDIISLETKKSLNNYNEQIIGSDLPNTTPLTNFAVSPMDLIDLGGSKFRFLWRVNGVPAKYSDAVIMNLPTPAPQRNTCEMYAIFREITNDAEGINILEYRAEDINNIDLTKGSLIVNVLSGKKMENGKVILSSLDKTKKKLIGRTERDISLEGISTFLTPSNVVYYNYGTVFVGIGINGTVPNYSNPQDYLESMYMNGSGEYVLRAEFSNGVTCERKINIIVPENQPPVIENVPVAPENRPITPGCMPVVPRNLGCLF